VPVVRTETRLCCLVSRAREMELRASPPEGFKNVRGDGEERGSEIFECILSSPCGIVNCDIHRSKLLDLLKCLSSEKRDT
jgi:hypothetical protein